jgi:hypothetical protein
MRRREIEVIEVSRCSFTIRISQHLANQIKVGKEFRLFHQGMLWLVEAKQKWLHQHNEVDIEFEQLAELTPPKIKHAVREKSQMVSAGNSPDFMLTASIIGVVVLALLIMPSWGGEWGTSQVICDAVTTVFKALASLVTGKS